MRYELINNSNKGIITERTPIMQDIRETYNVEFIAPDGVFVVLFKGADGVEYKNVIKDGLCKIPKELLKKEQFVEVIVCEVDGETIIHSWECEPLKITAFLGMRKSQLQVSCGLADKDYINKLSSAEIDIIDLNATIATQTEEIRELNKFKELTANELLKAQQAIVALQNKLDGLIQEINI